MNGYPTKDQDARLRHTPCVSIAIPVFNGENFLSEAAKSVLRQTYTDLELIIVDNASTDGTAEICRLLSEQDSRVRVYRNERNLGAAPNYNRGLDLARGVYFKWLSHDDWLSDNYIEECVNALERFPQFVIAHGMPREMVDAQTPFLDSEYTVQLFGGSGPVERFAKAMRMDRACHAIFGLMRTHVVRRTTSHRPYYTSDRNLVAEMALLGRFLCVPEAIFYNRKHSGQSMAQSNNRLFLNVWQDTSNVRSYSTLHLSRLRHAYEIWGRYPEIASRFQLGKACASYMFSPRKLLHYSDELAWSTMPRIYSGVRATVRMVYRTIRPPKSYLGNAQSINDADFGPVNSKDAIEMKKKPIS
ncbi:glycosyltransferase family 2 protein [Novosphingobium sp. AP12]|uniref:glycosyltransferase family 2 protein n=1 Tax=Novosphingobium sp. AP12 TaxID=1144305 RepID=UPI0012F9432E|nr:glycosyltransferase family 2 protein [Novosphingobium sp. AP12]